MAKHAKQYRIERDEALAEIKRLNALLQCIGRAVIKGLDKS